MEVVEVVEVVELLPHRSHYHYLHHIQISCSLVQDNKIHLLYPEEIPGRCCTDLSTHSSKFYDQKYSLVYFEHERFTRSHYKRTSRSSPDFARQQICENYREPYVQQFKGGQLCLNVLRDQAVCHTLPLNTLVRVACEHVF